MTNILRGTVFESAGMVVQVLGGPVIISRQNFYTVRILKSWSSLPTLAPGRTLLESGSILYGWMPRGMQPVILRKDPYRFIPYGTCSECDEEEMIFYEGDYICAWCREKLEEVF